MIYNLVQYLVDTLATNKFVSNGFQSNDMDNVTTVNEAGGFPNPDHDRKDFSVQIISRAKDKPKSRKQSFDIYDIINKKFGLLLPASTVDGNVFAAVMTWKIVAVALPGFIGNDENGRPQFSTNYTITTE